MLAVADHDRGLHRPQQPQDRGDDVALGASPGGAVGASRDLEQRLQAACLDDLLGERLGLAGRERQAQAGAVQGQQGVRDPSYSGLASRSQERR